MKTYISMAMIILGTSLLKAQQTEVLDTIYANDQKNVALFFPEPVRQGITGNENFIFTYNQEKQQYFGLLQAKPGNESNLLVVSLNGAIFSYIVKYKEELQKLNYFIPEEAAIGKEIPLKLLPETDKEPENISIDDESYYSRFCSHLLNKRPLDYMESKRKNGIVLKIENVVFDKEELYFVVQIRNQSTLDYDLNFLKFSVETRKKGRKKSMQKIPVEPVYIENMPVKVKEGKVKRLVYVLPKFSLSDDRNLVVELNEKNGERNVRLKVKNKFINNPN